MKIQFASDFHYESSKNSQFLLEPPVDPVGDVLVLAGDVTVLGREVPRFEQFVDWCSGHFKHTLIVPGNHEYYGGYDMGPTLQGWELQLRHNVKMVNNKSVLIDGVEFFLTTLWSFVPQEDCEMVDKHMAECSQAVLNGTPFKANMYTQLHSLCRQWLDEALASSSASHKVVVTHHCPVWAEDPQYESNGLSHAFVNHMEDYVEASGVDAWIFGHTHYNGASGTRLGRTLLCSNQVGYTTPEPCKLYAKNACIEI